MRLSVLGCSGGIGGSSHTTTLLVDQDILIDAGTGLNELSLSELCEIDHVFLTHSHLDHICCLPFLVDSVGWMRDRPLTVYASGATIETLRNHIFNWSIWPDFSEIPNVKQPIMRFREIGLGEVVELQGRRIRALPATHTVPAVGYHLDSGQGSLVFSGDTHVNDDLWELVNQIENLRYLIIETAFSEKERALADLSLHLCPSLLAGELAKFRGDAEVYITHLKPGEVDLTMQEIERHVQQSPPKMLLNNQVLEF
ncbi:MAG: 3',5'-cyclic-nucleotide phosphodiesterase [Gallionella sp.]|nr:3',5'-cyclic-nucleotide phosphodiesterase [Gallionella sp.]MDD4946215.1 3',5'-cyclic-nucleotide phosphodiesterase [Gallionella sp.]MDD5611677.1 3',5'-cyclic-nucleotide phosphodiesterase [Gallionella sp.]